jgi:hypothetical protein
MMMKQSKSLMFLLLALLCLTTINADNHVNSTAMENTTMTEPGEMEMGNSTMGNATDDVVEDGESDEATSKPTTTPTSGAYFASLSAAALLSGAAAALAL